MTASLKTAMAVDARIHGRLHRLGALLRLRLVLRGLGWVAVAATAGVLASFALDYGLHRMTLQHMSRPLRALVGMACLAGVGAVAWRRLIRGLAHRIAEFDLAILVEKGNPGLQDRLASALEFERGGASPAGASDELMRRVIAEANEAALPIRYGDVLRSRPMWMALLAATGAAMAVAALAAVRPDLAAPWFARNVLMRNVYYPKQTVLEVVGGRTLRVLRGDALHVTVTARSGRVKPDEVTFRIRFPSAGKEVLEAVPFVRGERGVYRKTFAVVGEAFTFRVTGNDDDTGEIGVELVEAPALSQLDLEVRNPVYTALPPQKVNRGKGTIVVPEDSTIVLAGVATKDLAGARMLLDGEQVGSCRVAGGDGGSRRVEGSFLLRAPVPFRPRLGLQVALKDTEGFENPVAASFVLNLRQDQAPVVQLDVEGMGGRITPRAVLPMTVVARDDYGVAQIGVECTVQSAPLKPMELVLGVYDPNPPEPNPVKTPFDIQKVVEKTGTNALPVQIGEILRFQAIASDARPASAGGAHTSKSSVVTFRLVSDDELKAEVTVAQRAERDQIRQCATLQKAVRERTETAVANASKETTLAIAQRDLTGIEDGERQIGDLIERSVGNLEDLAQRLRNNRVLAGADDAQLRGKVIDPLRRVSRESVASLVRELEAARALASGNELAAKLIGLVGIQDGVTHALDAIVQEMGKYEDKKYVEDNLQKIIRQSEELRPMLRKSSDGEREEPGRTAPAGEGKTP